MLKGEDIMIKANARSKKIVGIVMSIVFVVSFIVCGAWLATEFRLNRMQESALNELIQNAGEYNEHTIVLQNTTKKEAQRLAKKFDAKLRITSNGNYATLTLSPDVTVEDIYSKRSNRSELSKLSLDYYVKASDIELVDTDQVEQNSRLPMSPNYTVSDTQYTSQTYVDYINIGETWNRTRGSGITVAVIDSGIDTDHPEFAGRISEYSYNATEDKIVKDYTTENGEYDWSLIEDEQGHGTAVTGVIAAAMDGSGIVGIASEVEIIVIKAECDENGQFLNGSDLVFGLYYAIERDVDVVNMSFGGNGDYSAPAQLAVDSDIVCVAAAGNDSTASLTFPAADENVIGVGALADESWELANYSNFGDNTEVVAPGTTYTTKMGGGYGIMQGTSLASPVVAGAIALFRAVEGYNFIEVSQIREVLHASTYDLGDLGPDYYYGYGALDVNAFICEERGKVTFNMLTDELENTEQIFIRNHTLQDLPEPERNYAVFDGWYYDIHCTEELQWYEDVFSSDLTLYANWVNEEDGVPYIYVTLPDNTIEIRGYTGRRRYITIPDMIDGKIVSSIGDFAFSGQNRLRQINLPKYLNHIGLGAFEDCSNLLNMTIPDGVTEIESSAFVNNIRLSYVAFGNDSKLQIIGDFAFKGCGKLEHFELPKEVEYFNGSALIGTTLLKNIEVRKGNKNFTSENGILFNKTKSTIVAYPAGRNGEYSIPKSVQTIGTCAFAYAKIKSVDLNGVQTIGGSAFQCSQLESLVIPDSVTKMGEQAFANCYYLKSVITGNGLTEIPVGAFAYNFALKSVYIAKNITVIKGTTSYDGAFLQTSALTELTFASDSKLQMINSYVFYFSGLKELNLPSSLVSIGSYAFYNNILLSDVSFGDGSNLQTIGRRAFAATGSLQQITLPKNLRKIGGFAFSDSGLKTVNIPASVSMLGAGAFASCPFLTEIKVEADNAVYKDVDGVVYDKAMEKIVAYPAGNTATHYDILSGIKEVGEASFYGTKHLQSVNVPQGVTVIGKQAFASCESMQSYSLPNTLQEIREEAFMSNVSLGYIFIPNNVVQIGRHAFAESYNLWQIDLSDNSKLPRISYGSFAYTGIYSFRVPANVSTIAQEAFIGSTRMTSVTFASGSKLESISAYMFKGVESLQSITFESGSALTSIQAHGFEGMVNLTSVDFGDAKVDNIDNFAFRFCESLITLDMSNVKFIGRFAFYGCYNLERLEIPSSIEFIGRYAFLGAENLNIYFAGDSLPLALQENWNYGINGYYVGVKDVVICGDWQYAKLSSGGISIINYTGTETEIDLTTVDFGGEITQIGGHAFYGSHITSIKLPDTLKTIEAYAFAYSQLEKADIPSSVIYIAKNAYQNTPINTLIFGENSKLEKIEQSAFERTKNLNTVTIPSSVKTLGSSVFELSGITEVIFESGINLTEIPQKAFMGADLREVKIPDSVILINHNAFRDNILLESITFGSGKVQLMSNVFYNTGLKSLHIPANVDYIGEYAFVGLDSLSEITVDENNAWYSSKDGLLYNKDGSKLLVVPAAKSGKVTLSGNVEIIGFGAFENTDITEIEFAEDCNILTLGYRAFYGAENLKTITIPSSIVSIDYYAFAQCEKLETVIFEENSSLTGIYEGAFYGCKNLKNIILPDSIVEISDFAFYGCSSLTKIPVSETTGLMGIYDYAFAYSGITELNLPESLVDIGNYAFMGTKLTKITFPTAQQKYMTIGLGAFEQCNYLEEITLPFIGAGYEDNEISWLGYVFGAGSFEANQTYMPKSLKKVTIAEGITYVGPLHSMV